MVARRKSIPLNAEEDSNLVVVIHEMHELGIEPGGFGSPPEPRVIRFPGA